LEYSGRGKSAPSNLEILSLQGVRGNLSFIGNSELSLLKESKIGFMDGGGVKVRQFSWETRNLPGKGPEII